MQIKRNRDVISFISNGYRGMLQRQETIEVEIETLRKYGNGTCSEGY